MAATSTAPVSTGSTFEMLAQSPLSFQDVVSQKKMYETLDEVMPLTRRPLKPDEPSSVYVEYMKDIYAATRDALRKQDLRDAEAAKAVAPVQNLKRNITFAFTPMSYNQALAVAMDTKEVAPRCQISRADFQNMLASQHAPGAKDSDLNRMVSVAVRTVAVKSMMPGVDFGIEVLTNASAKDEKTTSTLYRGKEFHTGAKPASRRFLDVIPAETNASGLSKLVHQTPAELQQYRLDTIAITHQDVVKGVIIDPEKGFYSISVDSKSKMLSTLFKNLKHLIAKYFDGEVSLAFRLPREGQTTYMYFNPSLNRIIVSKNIGLEVIEHFEKSVFKKRLVAPVNNIIMVAHPIPLSTDTHPFDHMPSQHQAEMMKRTYALSVTLELEYFFA